MTEKKKSNVISLSAKIAEASKLNGSVVTTGEEAFYGNAPMKKEQVEKHRNYEDDYITASAMALNGLVKDLTDVGDTVTMQASMGRGVTVDHTALKVGEEWKVNTSVTRDLSGIETLIECHKSLTETLSNKL